MPVRQPRTIGGRQGSDRSGVRVGIRGSAAAAITRGFFPNPIQQIPDSGFASAPSWTLAGAGLGTTSVTGGVLNIISTTNVYTAVPTAYVGGATLPGGTYTVTFTVLNYTSGSLSASASSASSLSSSVDGTVRSANGTYTQDLLLVAPGGYIGIKGQGAAIADILQVDNFTVVKSS